MTVCELNTFIRAHAVAPVTSEHGYHVGGITGFLMSLGYAIKNINPTRVIIPFDGKGGSQRRKTIYPDYKAGRKTHVNIINTEFYSTKEEEVKSMEMQLRRLLDYLDTLPVQYMAIDKIEADDAIAYLTSHFQRKYDSEVYIMSTDHDYYQLINQKTIVWSPIKKVFYTQEKFNLEFEGLPSNNYLLYKVLIGDGSDNIPGIKGVGLRTIKKNLPFLFENNTKISLDRLFSYVEEENKKKETKVLTSIIEGKKQIELNYDLMQLHNVDISATIKESIISNISQPINRLSKHKFISYLVADGINTAIKSPDVWLQTVFTKLDMFSGQID